MSANSLHRAKIINSTHSFQLGIKYGKIRTTKNGGVGMFETVTQSSTFLFITALFNLLFLAMPTVVLNKYPVLVYLSSLLFPVVIVLNIILLISAII